jgi:hypothetical protein
VGAVQPENVERYLERARRQYRRRHGHFPEYKSWRGTQTNGIHMLSRMGARRLIPATAGHARSANTDREENVKRGDMPDSTQRNRWRQPQLAPDRLPGAQLSSA